MSEMIEFHPINFEHDFEQCVQFRMDSYRSSFPGSDEWKKYWNEMEYRNWIVNHAKRYPEGALHFFYNNEIIGQLELTYSSETGHVSLYYLRPEYRGKGFGETLQTKVESVLRAHGCKTATLRVSPKNQRAIRFYLKQGWTDLGQDEDYEYVNLFKINL